MGNLLDLIPKRIGIGLKIGGKTLGGPSLRTYTQPEVYKLQLDKVAHLRVRVLLALTTCGVSQDFPAYKQVEKLFDTAMNEIGDDPNGQGSV